MDKISAADEIYMGLALEEARSAESEGEIPVGAVIVKDRKVIARAHNRVEADKSALAHAEILCIQQAGKALGTWRLADCTLYVTLEPCPMCAGAIVNARVPRVVYGLKDPRAGSFGSLIQLNAYPFHHKVELSCGAFEPEIKTMMRDFFALRREQGAKEKR